MELCSHNNVFDFKSMETCLLETITTNKKRSFYNEEVLETANGNDFIKMYYPFARKCHLEGDCIASPLSMKYLYDQTKDFCIDFNAIIFDDASNFGKLKFHAEIKTTTRSLPVVICFCIRMHPVTEKSLCTTKYVSGCKMQYAQVLYFLREKLKSDEYDRPVKRNRDRKVHFAV